MRPVTFWTQSWKHLRETHDSVNKVTFVLLQRFDGLLAVARRLLNDEVNVLRVEASLVDRAVVILLLVLDLLGRSKVAGAELELRARRSCCAACACAKALMSSFFTSPNTM